MSLRHPVRKWCSLMYIHIGNCSLFMEMGDKISEKGTRDTEMMCSCICTYLCVSVLMGFDDIRNGVWDIEMLCCNTWDVVLLHMYIYKFVPVAFHGTRLQRHQKRGCEKWKWCARVYVHIRACPYSWIQRLIAGNPPPGGGSLLSGSLIQSRVTVASRREISGLSRLGACALFISRLGACPLFISRLWSQEPPPPFGGFSSLGVSLIKRCGFYYCLDFSIFFFNFLIFFYSIFFDF